MQEKASWASENAKAAYDALSDKVIDSWGESQLKEFCDKNGISGMSLLFPASRLASICC